jgi:Rps23 Pro-64 3,4-dihydroxylase Tpa1-like proline 4-hydroxylase
MLGGTGNVFENASDEQVARWEREFRTATPFPHFVVDDFLEDADGLREEFPDLDWPGWSKMVEVYQPGKRYLSDIDAIPPKLRETIIRLNSPRTLRTLESITGIKQLLSDPYLDGAGLHASGPGGVLLPHSDFHFHNHGIFRRLNLLVYLNEEWGPDDGGLLEFYADAEAKTEPERVIPIQGRAVLFATNEQSVHGFTQPVVEGRYRRSIALYYYTSTETEEYSGDRTTVWRHHGDHAGWVNRARLSTFRVLMKASRGASRLAHKANPNR